MKKGFVEYKDLTSDEIEKLIREGKITGLPKNYQDRVLNVKFFNTPREPLKKRK